MLQLELEEAQLKRLCEERRGLEARQASLEAGKVEAERSVLAAVTVEAHELAALDAHRRWVTAQQELLAPQVAECTARIAAQRERARKAEQDLKLLEKLKERRLAQWSAEVDKEYQALADETFLAQWQREA